EPVARLEERLIREIKVVSGHDHLFGRRSKVEKRRPDLILDLPAEISEFILALLQRGPRSGDISGDSAAVENGDGCRSHDGEGGMELAKRSHTAVVSSHLRRWIAAAVCGSYGVLCRSHMRLVTLQV